MLHNNTKNILNLMNYRFPRIILLELRENTEIVYSMPACRPNINKYWGV